MDYIPYLVVGPGQIIEKYMAARKMTNMDLSKELGIPLAEVSSLLSNNLTMTLPLAGRLSRVFNNSSEFWMNLYINYVHNLEVKKLKPR